jgi:hypothetical protein
MNVLIYRGGITNIRQTKVALVATFLFFYAENRAPAHFSANLHPPARYCTFGQVKHSFYLHDAPDNAPLYQKCTSG